MTDFKALRETLERCLALIGQKETPLNADEIENAWAGIEIALMYNGVDPIRTVVAALRLAEMVPDQPGAPEVEWTTVGLTAVIEKHFGPMLKRAHLEGQTIGARWNAVNAHEAEHFAARIIEQMKDQKP